MDNANLAQNVKAFMDRGVTPENAKQALLASGFAAADIDSAIVNYHVSATPGSDTAGELSAGDKNADMQQQQNQQEAMEDLVYMATQQGSFSIGSLVRDLYRSGMRTRQVVAYAVIFVAYCASVVVYGETRLNWGSGHSLSLIGISLIALGWVVIDAGLRFVFRSLPST